MLAGRPVTSRVRHFPWSSGAGASFGGLGGGADAEERGELGAEDGFVASVQGGQDVYQA